MAVVQRQDISVIHQSCLERPGHRALGMSHTPALMEAAFERVLYVNLCRSL